MLQCYRDPSADSFVRDAADYFLSVMLILDGLGAYCSLGITACAQFSRVATRKALDAFMNNKKIESVRTVGSFMNPDCSAVHT